MTVRISPHRKSQFFITTILTFGLGATAALAQNDSMPSQAEMWEMIQQQQQQIEALKKQIEGQPTGDTLESVTVSGDIRAKQAKTEETLTRLEAKIAETDMKVEATGGLLENMQTAGTAGEGWWNRTSVGGYGELHYNGGDKDEVDFHRFVLYVGHQFNDWLSFQSELEVEHALSGDGEPGEVELEQAFITADLTQRFGLRFGETDRHTARAGLFLVPVGIINETHEPNTFFGVERNNIENKIIPSTWWEAGIGLSGTFGQGFSYDVAWHSGLEVDSSSYSIRGGRQKVAKATAKDGAVTARLKWTGVPGVEVAVSGQHQSDITQGERGVGATLLEAHADILRNGFGLRALYARWDLDGKPDVKALGRDKQYGWYVEPSYRFDTQAGTLGAFVRHEQWNTEAGLDNVDTLFKSTSLGINYWPHPRVVFKMDYQFEDAPLGQSEDDRINLGFGYQF
jgi:hypothetical protein